jgi:DeoR family glycerol-3-phosphate regulon repressor
MTEPTERSTRIIDLVRRNGRVAVEDLARLFSVSHETIRRDLVALDGSGLLRRFHGGAAALNLDHEGPFSLRMFDQIEEKRRIARRAAQLFSSGDSLFVDTGSTTLAFAEELAWTSGLTVVTNCERIAAAVSRGGGNQVVLIGGAYRAGARECLGALAVEQVRRLRANDCVLTVGALGAEGGAMDFDIEEAEVARAMIERSDRVTVLADGSKLDRKALIEVCGLAAINRLVTDREPSPDLHQALEAQDVRLFMA